MVRYRTDLSSGERTDLIMLVTVFGEEERRDILADEVLSILDNVGLVVSEQRGANIGGNFVIENIMSAEFFNITALNDVTNELISLGNYKTTFVSLESLQVNKQLFQKVGRV